MLACPKLIRGVVRTRAEIAARSETAHHDAIARFRRRIGDAELGEKRILAQIFQKERLLASELTAQTSLPLDRRQVDRCTTARQLVLPAAASRAGLYGFHGMLSKPACDVRCADISSCGASA